MNIALSAVVIFILLLPPIAFYLAFNLGRFPKAGPKLGLLEGLMLSAIFSIILHAIAIYFIGKQIRFDVIALLVGGDLKTFGTTIPNDLFKTQFQEFVWYNSILVVFAIIMGRTARWLIVRTGFHARSFSLRLYNQWWYLFQGYKVEDSVNLGVPVSFDIVFVDALVNTNAGTMIYSGYLIDYVCTGETLDRIYLSQVQKREFKQTKMNDKGNYLHNEPGESVALKGNTMSIPYSNIINLNLHFITFPIEFEEIKETSKIDVPKIYFQIFREVKTDEYIFVLRSENNEIIIYSEPYTTKQRCLESLLFVKQSASDDARYSRLNVGGKYFFKFVGPNGQVFASSEQYLTEAARDNAIAIVKRISTDAAIEDRTK